MDEIRKININSITTKVIKQKIIQKRDEFLRQIKNKDIDKYDMTRICIGCYENNESIL